jgi:hypothetical protein
MTEQQKTELVLAIHLTTENTYDGKPYGRFEAFVYCARNGGYEETPWTYLAAYESDYAGFAMEASYGNLAICEGQAYGFAYGYKPDYGLVRTHEAERYTRGLKRVDRAYEKRCQANGRPQSLGQEVVYLLQALGITRAFVRVPASVIARQGGGASNRDWRPLDSMEDIRAHIDRAVHELRRAQLDAAGTTDAVPA